MWKAANTAACGQQGKEVRNCLQSSNRVAFLMSRRFEFNVTRMRSERINPAAIHLVTDLIYQHNLTQTWPIIGL